MADHRRRITGELGATGRLLHGHRHVDPSQVVHDPRAASRRLHQALGALNDAQQAQARAAGTALVPWPVRWGDAAAHASRKEYYRGQLHLGPLAVTALALTPLPAEWVAEALDFRQALITNARPVDHCDRHHTVTWYLMLMAADALAGTGQLPTPRMSWTWCPMRESTLPSPLPAVPARYYRRSDRAAQQERVEREAWWAAAEEVAGDTFDGALPVQRYVPGWNLREAAQQLTGVDWWGPSKRQLDQMELATPTPPPDEGRAWWSRALQAVDAELHRARPPWWVTSPGPRNPGRPAPSHIRSWWRSGDLRQRARWRAMTLSGGDPKLTARLEQALVRDTLSRYLTQQLVDAQTVLPAQRAWTTSLHRWDQGPTWKRRPDVESGRVARWTLLGFPLGPVAGDPQLRAVDDDDLQVMVALTGGHPYGPTVQARPAA